MGKSYRNRDQETIKEVDAKERRRLRRIERDPLHQGLILERSKLKAREFNLNLKTLIGNTTVLSQQAGFYCSVCECLLKDSITYLDHINGKWHQKALGISMRVEKVGANKVRARINDIQNKKDNSKMPEMSLDSLEQLKANANSQKNTENTKMLDIKRQKFGKMRTDSKTKERQMIALKMGW